MIAAFHMTVDVLACPKIVSRQGTEEEMARVRPVFGLKNSPVVVRRMAVMIAVVSLRLCRRRVNGNHSYTAGNAEARMRHSALCFGWKDRRDIEDLPGLSKFIQLSTVHPTARVSRDIKVCLRKLIGLEEERKCAYSWPVPHVLPSSKVANFFD